MLQLTGLSARIQQWVGVVPYEAAISPGTKILRLLPRSCPMSMVAAEENGSNGSSTNKNGDVGSTWHVVPWWKCTCPSTYIAQTAAHSPQLTQRSTRSDNNLQVASSEASPGHRQGISAVSLRQEPHSTSPTTIPFLFYGRCYYVYSIAAT